MSTHTPCAPDRGAAAAERVTAALLSVGYGIALFHRNGLQAIAPLIAVDFSLTPAESADLAAVFFWTYLLIMIPTGLLADAIGARRVVLAGCVVTAAGAFLFRTGDSIVELTLARVLIAAGSANTSANRWRGRGEGRGSSGQRATATAAWLA